MPVFVFDKSGVVEERPEAEHKAIGHEILAHNLKNPKNERSLFVGPVFPPPRHVLDAKTGALRLKTLSEQIADGEIEKPAGYRLEKGAAGEVLLSPYEKIGKNGQQVEKTIEEKIKDGLVEFNPKTQKVEDGQIVRKTTQDLLDAKELTHDELRERTVQRLRAEIEAYFRTARTPKGLRVDSLARQKAALSFPYRKLDKNDADKKKLIDDGIIYDDAAIDEIMAEVKRIQIGYEKAKSALQAVHAAGQPAAKYEDINLENYL